MISPHQDLTPAEGDWLFAFWVMVSRMPNSSTWRYLENQYPRESRRLLRETKRRIKMSEQAWQLEDWSVQHWEINFPMYTSAAAIISTLMMSERDQDGLGFTQIMEHPNSRQEQLRAVVLHNVIEDQRHN